MHFYELHEGDSDVFSDILLARETEMEPDEFFELVQQIRLRVQDTHQHDTLIEAIADELERDHDFITVSDDRLTAAVNVSKFEDENYLADLEAEAEAEGSDRSREDDLDELTGEYRSVVLELEPKPDLRSH